MTNVRNKIATVVNHYQQTQASGLKDIEKQLEIFTDDCTWVIFATEAVLGNSGLLIINNKDSLREGCEKYNNHIGSPNNITINYFDLVIDENNLRCNFNMLLHIKIDPKNPVYSFNTLQFHINENFKIYKAYNWQGKVGNTEIGDILARSK